MLMLLQVHEGVRTIGIAICTTHTSILLTMQRPGLLCDGATKGWSQESSPTHLGCRVEQL